MVRRPFGWTGVEVSVIGQGTWRMEGWRGTERRAIEALRLGLDLGLTHIDTAEMYGDGRVEELVAEAIAGRRHEVFLVSKVLPSNASYRGTLAACDRSLSRLRTDWLDLYLLHWPSDRYPIAETMAAMEALVAAGKVRFIGVSNFDVQELAAAQRALSRERLACDQVLYHLEARGIERRLLPYCAEHGIAVVAYSPFAQGRFPSPRSPRGRLLAEIGARYGRTPRQVALAFLTRHPHVFAIPKAGHPDHVRENAGGAGWTLAPEDVAAIDRAFPAPDTDVPLWML
ncbi:MAG TPA: aldo/keto reductase [Thermodesulfobacteriota bacterium]|nr:aldo/keto reductase [Thermodesulfobacteriota bacterium]